MSIDTRNGHLGPPLAVGVNFEESWVYDESPNDIERCSKDDVYEDGMFVHIACYPFAHGEQNNGSIKERFNKKKNKFKGATLSDPILGCVNRVSKA